MIRNLTFIVCLVYLISSCTKSEDNFGDLESKQNLELTVIDHIAEDTTVYSMYAKVSRIDDEEYNYQIVAQYYNYFNNKTLYIKLTDINSGDYFIENGADVRLISSNGNEIIANDGSVSIRNNDFDGSFSVSYTRSLLLTDYEKVSLIGTFKDVPYTRD